MRDRSSSRTATISLVVIFILYSHLPIAAETAVEPSPPQPAVETMDAPISEPVVDAVPTIEVTTDAAVELITKPVVEAATEEPAEPAVELIAEPITEPVMEAATEAPAEPAVEPIAEPIAEPITEPVMETATEAPAEPAVELIAEPITEPVAEPAVEAATEVPAKPAVRSVLYKTEAFLTPGIVFYGDLTGFKTEFGAQFVLGERFVIDSTPKNIVVGASLLYETVPNTEIPVMITGLDLRFGYRFILSDFLPILNIRIIPSLLTGPVYQSVERSSREIYRGLAWHLAPTVSLDLSPFGDGQFQALKAGLYLGYNFYLSELSFQNFHAGLFTSWTF